jgi:ATP-dependent RNA helicase DDX3X
MLRPCVIYGGGPVGEQMKQLALGCDVLIGTPGRLCDFIERPHVLSLRRLKYVVIDEADEMLNADWETELNKIMSGGGKFNTSLSLQSSTNNPRPRRGKYYVHDVFRDFPQVRPRTGHSAFGP